MCLHFPTTEETISKWLVLLSALKRTAAVPLDKQLFSNLPNAQWKKENPTNNVFIHCVLLIKDTCFSPPVRDPLHKIKK